MDGMIAYVNRDVFLVEILGFTHHCSLRCAYCDWKKEPFTPLSKQEIDCVRRHLVAAAELIARHYPMAKIIVFSGGEPYVHPEVVQIILDVFEDYWVRINTNGLHMDASGIDALKRHGRAYLALSLDGHTLSANRHRIHTQAELDRILRAVDDALAADVPVALLCTLHRDNADEFEAYLRFLEARWPEAIAQGRLMMAAHRLSVYDKPQPVVSEEQRLRMMEMFDAIDSPIVNPIRAHYQKLWQFDTHCGIHKWAASMHFTSDALATSGRFTAWRCGMRGVGLIGEFDVMKAQAGNDYACAMADGRSARHRDLGCSCFVDWRAFDLVFSGEIPLEEAMNWFIPFRDPGIQKWIQRYRRFHQANEFD